MTPTVEIRRATAADADALAACYREAYRVEADRGYPTRMTEIDAETVVDWLDGEAVTLVAEPVATGGEPLTQPPGPLSTPSESTTPRIVGTGRVLEERDVPYLERLAVVEAWQGGGVGRRLFDRLEALVRDRGYERAQLTTYADHPFLYDWYRERGYEPIETHEKPDRPYDYVTMERRFDAAPTTRESVR